MKIKLIFLCGFLSFFGQITAQHNTTTSKKVESIQVIDFESMPHDTISKGITRQWFHGAKGQMAYFHLKKGAHIPMHKHPNEQITYILKGKVKINILDKGNKKTYIISAGQVIVLPENVSHEFFALENTLDLDVHVPVRQDWLTNELPTYLKKSK